MTSPPAATDTIGVFDSGVGGLSVLRALHARLPYARLHYVADSLHAPYGDRGADDVTDRSYRLTQHLLDAGAKMIVVACNTATTVAIRALRTRWPEVPFVGVEPGIKPAVTRSRNGRIGVLATSRTIGSERLRSLVSEHAPHRTVVLQPCPGLADAIEGGDARAELVDQLLQRYCAPLKASQVDTVVLGCTHYPFVAERIQSIMSPEVALIDTAEAVAQRAQSLWPAAPRDEAKAGLPTLQTTSDPAVLTALARRWIDPSIRAARVAV
jgi:glutamate racemase